MKSPLSPVALATALAAPALATWMHRAQDPDPLLPAAGALAQEVGDATAQDLDLEWLGAVRTTLAGQESASPGSTQSRAVREFLSEAQAQAAQALHRGDYERALASLGRAQELDPDGARHLDQLRAHLDAQRADLEAQRAALEAQRAELEARLAERRRADGEPPREERMRDIATELDRLRSRMAEQQTAAAEELRAAHDEMLEAHERIARARVEQDAAEAQRLDALARERALAQVEGKSKEWKHLAEKHQQKVESLLREKLAGLHEKELLEVHERLGDVHEKVAKARAGQQAAEAERRLAEVSEQAAALEARLAEEHDRRVATIGRSRGAPSAGGAGPATGLAPGVTIYSQGTPAPSAPSGAGVTIIVQNGDVHVYTDGRGGPPLVATEAEAPPPRAAAGATTRATGFGYSGTAPHAAGQGFSGSAPRPAFDPRPGTPAAPATVNRFYGAFGGGAPAPALPRAPRAFARPSFYGPAVAPGAPSTPAPPAAAPPVDAPVPPGAPSCPEACPDPQPEAQQPGAGEPSVAELFGRLNRAAVADGTLARAMAEFEGAQTQLRGLRLAANTPAAFDPLAVPGPDSILAEILALARELKSDVGSLRSELQELRREVERAPLR